MQDNPRELWHYCCEHSARLIEQTGELRPGADHLVWLSTFDRPIRDALGLTSLTIACDRTTHRVTVPGDALGIVPWTRFRRVVLTDPRVSAERLAERRRTIEGLESVDGARPAHWWVGLIRLPVVAVELVAEL